jgi:3-hydroxyacyl-CoA dehydrogenase
MNRFNVRKVAVLGAGVMGAQIAAHLVNVQGAGGAVRPAGQGRAEERHRAEGHRQPEEAQARAAGRGRRRGADPAANYEEHLDLLAELRPGDRGDRRAHGLEAGPVHQDRAGVAPHAIVASNTSGLSITKLARRCPRRSSRASAASTSSTRRATCSWWS